MKSISLNKENVKLAGRTLCRNGKLWLTHSAAGCEFIFTGKRLVLTVGCDKDCYDGGKRCNKPRIAIICDGRTVVKKVVDERTESYTIIDREAPATSTVQIIKLSEAAFSLAEVYPAEADDEAVIAPTAENRLKIEYIGDSITCGYGVDDSNMQSEFATEAENAMKSYAYISAQLLNADYSLFSYSGYGAVSGFTSDGVRNTREVLPPYYESCGFSYSSVEGERLQDIPWDHSRFKPDIVVLNLGTNDNSYCIANDGAYREFEDGYLAFLKTIRANNPDSVIICALGTMGTGPVPYIENAIKRMGDTKIVQLRLTTQNGLLGFGSNWHPSEETHRYAAEELVDFIRSHI